MVNRCTVALKPLHAQLYLRTHVKVRLHGRYTEGETFQSAKGETQGINKGELHMKLGNLTLHRTASLATIS